MARMQIEKAEQEMLVRWFRMQYPALLLFAIPNGGSRHILEAVSLRLSGVTSGIPDLMLATPAKGLAGLFIEMKRPIVIGSSKPTVSKEQRWVIGYLIEHGYGAEVCYGFEEAKDKIISYLN